MAETKVAGDEKKEAEGFLQELDGNPYTKVLADVFRDYTIQETWKRHERMISAKEIGPAGKVFFLKSVPNDGYIRLGVLTKADDLLIEVFAEPEDIFTKERLNFSLHDEDYFFRLQINVEHSRAVGEAWLFTEFIPDLYRRVKEAGL